MLGGGARGGGGRRGLVPPGDCVPEGLCSVLRRRVSGSGCARRRSNIVLNEEMDRIVAMHAPRLVDNQRIVVERD